MYVAAREAWNYADLKKITDTFVFLFLNETLFAEDSYEKRVGYRRDETQRRIRMYNTNVGCIPVAFNTDS